MKKEVIIFLLTYVIVTLIRGFILSFTDISLSIWSGNFNLITFLADITTWLLTYYFVRKIVSKQSEN